MISLVTVIFYFHLKFLQYPKDIYKHFHQRTLAFHIEIFNLPNVCFWNTKWYRNLVLFSSIWLPSWPRIVYGMTVHVFIIIFCTLAVLFSPKQLRIIRKLGRRSSKYYHFVFPFAWSWPLQLNMEFRSPVSMRAREEGGKERG